MIIDEYINFYMSIPEKICSEEFLPGDYEQIKEFYHYAPSSACINLLQPYNEKEYVFWASNLMFLNDKAEFVHGYELICSTILKYFDSRAELSDKVDIVKKYLEKCDMDTLCQDLYIICLCKTSDLYTQWINYGKKSGIQLGMNLKNVSYKILDSTGNYIPINTKPYKIIYDDEKKKEIIISGLNSILKKIKKNNNMMAERNLKYSIDKLLHLSCYFKHKAFESEEEFRLVFRPLCFDEKEKEKKISKEIYYREKEGVIVPYMKIKLCKESGDLYSSILVGPGANQENLVKDINHIIKHKIHPFSENKVECKMSEIPFRG